MGRELCPYVYLSQRRKCITKEGYKTTQQLKMWWTSTSLKKTPNRHFAKGIESHLLRKDAEPLETVQRKTTDIINNPKNNACVIRGLLGLSISSLWRRDFSPSILYTEKKSDDGRLFSFSEKCKTMILRLQTEGGQIQPRNKMQRWLNAWTAQYER